MSTALAEAAVTASPLTKSDEPLYEVVQGQRVELPPMSIYSNFVAGRLFNTLENYLGKQRLGIVVMEALLILDGDNNLRRRPDVAFVAADRWPLDREVPETGDWEVVPTIAIEVTSPSDLFTEVIAKVNEYFGYGVEEVWVVDPEEQQLYRYSSPTSVQIHDAQETLTGGDRLPGFEMPLRELFRRAVRTTSEGR